MKNIISYFLLTSFFLTGCSETTKKTAQLSSNDTKVSSYLEEIESLGFSGSVLVANKNEKILSKGFGSSDAANNVPNAPSTVFDIGSVTKQFTAAAILKLEMQGKLSVNDKISDYFSELPNDKTEITIHHLLTHSAGFPGAIGDDYTAISEEDFLKDVYNLPISSTQIGTYNYSNVGYSLLALIIEQVSKTSYEEYLATYLFSPAKMTQTGYIKPNWKPSQVAIGYRNDKALGKPNEQNWSENGPYLHLKGNGGILSTTEDLYKWHKALLNESVLSLEAKKKYYNPYIEEGEGAGSYYGYGWAIFPTSRDTQLITHNGGNGVFFGDFWRYFTEEITIIVLSNKGDSYTDIIASQIAGLLLSPDFEPRMPGNEPEVDNEAIENIVQNVVQSIAEGNAQSWGDFISENCSKDFIEMVPLETHFSVFNKFQKRLIDSNILATAIENDEIFARIKTPSEEFDMILAITEDATGEFKIDGIMLDK